MASCTTYGRLLRSDKPLSEHSPSEKFIEALLRNFGDDTDVVEYWTRDFWIPVGVHRDYDGDPRDGKVPRNVYIAYLELGDDSIRAPTVVFQPASSSSSSLPQRSPAESGAAAAAGPNGAEAPGVEAKRLGEVFIVPAVAGRVLRLPGSWLHAVPNPALQYLMGTEEAPAPETESRPRRTVLVLNTWPDQTLKLDSGEETELPAANLAKQAEVRVAVEGECEVQLSATLYDSIECARLLTRAPKEAVKRAFLSSKGPTRLSVLYEPQMDEL